MLGLQRWMPGVTEASSRCSSEDWTVGLLAAALSQKFALNMRISVERSITRWIRRRLEPALCREERESDLSSYRRELFRKTKKG